MMLGLSGGEPHIYTFVPTVMIRCELFAKLKNFLQKFEDESMINVALSDLHFKDFRPKRLIVFIKF